MTVIITKNSSTSSAVPSSSDLVQGELAVNVADGRLFTENNSATVIELGTTPSSITTGAITASGTLTANGQLVNANAAITGGAINGVIIGASSAAAITGSIVTASTGFVGGLTGNVTGNLTGNATGNLTGNVTGDLTGNVTAGSGTTTLHNLALTGTVDFNTARLTDIGTPTAATDAVTKAYADGLITDLIGGAPAALDTLNELAAAMDDDAAFHTTVTNSIATKLPLAGGTMSGAIAMGTAKITGLGDPTAAQDAATKTYVDTQAGGGLPKAGGTMTGAIAMSTNKITGMGDPTAAQDASTKAYTDSILGSATSAATSATAAATSATASATSATASATSATASASSATSSASSATSAAASWDQFDDTYLGQKSSNPSVDNDGDALATGALYFNTTANTLRVYNGSSWQDAGSAVNGTSSRQTYTATASQTTFSITYDVGYVDVYLNGSKLLSGTDFTASNGTSVVLAVGAAVNDIVDIVAYGTFNVADTYTQSASNARFLQLANNLSDLASAATALTNLGVTSTAAELNILDGVTSTAAELNLLDGVTATTAELNYTDGVTSNIQTQLDAKAGTSNPTLAGLTLSAELAGADQTVSRVNLKDYGEITNAIGNATGAKTIDLTAGNSVTATTTGATTWTFSNPTASDELCGFVLKLVNGGSATQTWPGSVDWPAATAPTLTTSGTDVLVFITCDGGTIWYGFTAGLALA
jgi:hypothetical protein